MKTALRSLSSAGEQRMILLDLAITQSLQLHEVRHQPACTVAIREALSGSDKWPCISAATVRDTGEGGIAMSWKIAKGEHFNIARQADMTYPALVSEGGAELLHTGTDRSDHTESFNYHDTSIARFGFIATRYANFHGRLLANDGQLLTDTWTVGFAVFMVVPRSGVVLSNEILDQIKLNIESALLSHPLWPSSYGRPDLPAKSVSFMSAN
jgi:hypothetical protein